MQSSDSWMFVLIFFSLVIILLEIYFSSFRIGIRLRQKWPVPKKLLFFKTKINIKPRAQRFKKALFRIFFIIEHKSEIHSLHHKSIWFIIIRKFGILIIRQQNSSTFSYSMVQTRKKVYSNTGKLTSEWV